jgi:uncharacterized protein
MPIKPHPTLLAALLFGLSNMTLIRELGRGGLRVALARVSKGARLFVHPRISLEVVKALSARETQPLLRAEPRVMFKYLTEYLGTDLSQSERASILIDHYTFLKDRVNQDFFRKIVDCRLELWRQTLSGNVYRIHLTFPRTTHDEGDLSLIFKANHVDIYTLSFTIGPGSIAGALAGHAVYIARIQGKGRGLPLIKKATKDCLDISPAALLLAATEGIASALELRHMVGLGADRQISARADSRPDGLVHAYDEFWTAAGGLRLERNMYHLAVPLPEKPIHAIKRNHRSRVLRKRAFKKLLREQVRRTFSDLALRTVSP